MVDFEPPSFSLGLDFDLDSDPQTTVTGNPSPVQPPSSSSLPTIQDLIDDDFECPTLFPAPERKALNPPRPLKRLRRGPTTEPALVGQKRGAVNLGRKDENPSYHSGCSSSKFPLPGPGFSISQSERTMKKVSNAPACANLTASPISRFQLIDSDSDDPSVSEQGKIKASGRITRSEDLWDDFCSEERFSIPTPTLDEVCKEYFTSMQNKNKDQNNIKECYQSTNARKNYEQQLNLGDPVPPSHRYFFHVDPRIQNLVHSRLPNFLPLGAVNNSGYMQPSTSVIDYMGQFSHGDGSKQGKNISAISSGKNRRSSKKSDPEEASEGSGSWVNPKDCAVTPKNAVKRRAANAVAQSAGYWYTASNGKRVYISKKGQELTGQIAYRNYKKESGAASNKKKGRAGAGSKRTKKKSGAGSQKSKKKSAAKKK